MAVTLRRIIFYGSSPTGALRLLYSRRIFLQFNDVTARRSAPTVAPAACVTTHRITSTPPCVIDHAVTLRRLRSPRRNAWRACARAATLLRATAVQRTINTRAR